MNNKWLTAMIEAAVLAVTLVAVFQELEKPPKARKWHGMVAGFIPYDFRPPTLDRITETLWNPYERRIFSPALLGVGWALNFHALLEDLRIVKSDAITEEDFLMPGKRMKEVLRRRE